MTDEQLSEILSHPRLHALIDKRAEESALRALVDAGIDLSHEQAARVIGCPHGSIRTYLCRGQLVNGKLPRTVTIASALAFKASYHARPKARRPRT